MVHRAFLRFGLAALLATTLLAGCGRKGPLELPPGAPQTQSPASAEAQQTRVAPLDSDPGLIQPPNKSLQRSDSEKAQQASEKPLRAINGPQPAPPKKTFALDPLL